MRKSTPLLGSLFCLCFAACATGGSSTTPSGPVVLEGARYKLLVAGGSLDGRVVEFLERGDTLRGCLAAPGNKLRSVSGIDMGTWVYSLKKKDGEQWEGVYRSIGTDGSITDKPVSVSFQGESLSWNLESATWERQSETGQLTADEKTKCTSK